MLKHTNNFTNKIQSNKFQLLVNQVAQQTGLEPKAYGNGYRMRCPAHNDNKASFTISEVNNGKILMYCFCGCSIDEICHALNINLKYLFPQESN